MSKFKVGDKGKFGPNGSIYEVVATRSDGRLIVENDVQLLNINGDGLSDCSNYRFTLLPKEEKFISYLFADGHFSKWYPEGERVDITQPYSAVLRAVKKDGKFTQHSLSRVDQTEEEFAQEAKVEKTTNKSAADSSFEELDANSIISLADFIDILSGKKSFH